MQKKVIVLAVSLFAAILGGCINWYEAKYTFNEKQYSESDLEEHISDLLESENTGIDIEVDLYEEGEE